MQIADCRGQIGALLIAALVASCGVQPERAIVDRFFSASRLRDRTALAKFSTVIFEPLEQGIVEQFDITKVTEAGTSKTVTAAAQVKLPDGRIVPKTLVLVLQKRDEANPDGGWLVTGVVTR